MTKDYLLKTGKAADSEKLNGKSADEYASAEDVELLSQNLANLVKISEVGEGYILLTDDTLICYGAKDYNGAINVNVSANQYRNPEAVYVYYPKAFA
jgi:hypothetical protein